MKVKNMQMKSIEARKFLSRDERPKQIRIDHNSSFTQVSSIDANSAEINFQYTASYGAVGMIKMEGSFIFVSEKAKELSDEWNSSRKMPNEIASQLHTAIMHACVPQAVGIAKDLQLPPPIPLPQVRLGQNSKSGQLSGPEVA